MAGAQRRLPNDYRFPRSIDGADQSHENHAIFIHSLIVLARARARHRRSRHDTRQAHDKHKTEGADLLAPCKISLHRQLHRRRMSNGSSSSSSVEEDLGSYATAVGVIASQFGTLVAVSCFVGNTRNTRERKTQKRIYQFYGFCQERHSLPPSVFDAARARSKRIPPPFPFFCPFF